jgi:hypothetical protein
MPAAAPYAHHAFDPTNMGTRVTSSGNFYASQPEMIQRKATSPLASEGERNFRSDCKIPYAPASAALTCADDFPLSARSGSDGSLHYGSGPPAPTLRKPADLVCTLFRFFSGSLPSRSINPDC